MPQLTFDTVHALGIDEAVRRLKEKVQAAKDAYGADASDLREEWNEAILSFGFKASGMKVSGTVTVESETVKIAAKVPFAAMMFKGMIEKRVRQELDAVLA